MAIEYFKAYHSLLDAVEPLNDAEIGRLFVACLTYSMTGEVTELRGNERFVFPGVRSQIDRDKKGYEARCKINAENGAHGGRPKNQTVFEETEKTESVFEKPKKPKEKIKEKKKEKNIEPPLSPLQGETGFGDALFLAFSDWLKYKAERNQAYKPTGLKSLISQIRSNAETYGESAVVDLIRECMASNWQGIIFDRLSKPQQYQKRNVPMGASGALGDAELEAIRMVLGEQAQPERTSP